MFRPVTTVKCVDLCVKALRCQSIKTFRVRGISYTQFSTLQKWNNVAVEKSRSNSLNVSHHFCTHKALRKPEDNNGSKQCNKRLEVSYEELLELMDKNEIHLIDVRTPKEIEEYGKIPNAINIPLSEVPDALLVDTPDKFKQRYGVDQFEEDDDIVFVCRAGNRSLRILNFALQNGFQRARHYPGGFDEWSSKPGNQKAHG